MKIQLITAVAALLSCREKRPDPDLTPLMHPHEHRRLPIPVGFINSPGNPTLTGLQSTSYTLIHLKTSLRPRCFLIQQSRNAAKHKDVFFVFTKNGFKLRWFKGKYLVKPSRDCTLRDD